MRRGLVLCLLLLAACGARSSLDVPDLGAEPDLAPAPDLAPPADMPAPDMPPPDMPAPDMPAPDMGPPCVPEPETCDGRDQDCDGFVDDGLICLSVAGVVGPPALLDPIEPQPDTRCGSRWFGYDAPDRASANPLPDFRQEDAVVVAVQRGLVCGGPYVALIADFPEDDDGGRLGVSWTSDFDALPVLGDEPTECMDLGGGAGICDFRWASCCTDGVLLGPFPESGCLRLTVSERPTPDPELGDFVVDTFVVVDGADNAFTFTPGEPIEICATLEPARD